MEIQDTNVYVCISSCHSSTIPLVYNPANNPHHSTISSYVWWIL